MKSKEINDRFVRYYTELGYEILPQVPMLDPSIPMSFVMSAGLVQIEASLAKENYRNGDKYVLIQDCFRHFDLDKVGKDAIHLSIFEMPGAFVFGPNKKSETIQKMWTLATTILGLDKERIWASYFIGGDVVGNHLPEDTTTRQSWSDVGIPENRIVGLDSRHNFWVQKGIVSAGNVKKCGPNTELFFDRGVDKSCGINCKPGCNCNRFVEFSNSLFVSCGIDNKDNSLYPLTHPFTETVIGVERVSMILAGAQSIFDIDDNKPIFNRLDVFITKDNRCHIEVESQKRVIVDHLKALYILISDGAPPPGKDGRARIIKILIRRVATHMIILGINFQDFLPVILVDISVVMSQRSDKKVIEKVLDYFSLEYHRFTKTLKLGERKILQFKADNSEQYLSSSQIQYLEKQLGIPPTIAERISSRGRLVLPSDEHRVSLSLTSKSNTALAVRGQ